MNKALTYIISYYIMTEFVITAVEGGYSGPAKYTFNKHATKQIIITFISTLCQK